MHLLLLKTVFQKVNKTNKFRFFVWCKMVMCAKSMASFVKFEHSSNPIQKWQILGLWGFLENGTIHQEFRVTLVFTNRMSKYPEILHGCHLHDYVAFHKISDFLELLCILFWIFELVGAYARVLRLEFPVSLILCKQQGRRDWKPLWTHGEQSYLLCVQVHDNR